MASDRWALVPCACSALIVTLFLHVFIFCCMHLEWYKLLKNGMKYNLEPNIIPYVHIRNIDVCVFCVFFLKKGLLPKRRAICHREIKIYPYQNSRQFLENPWKSWGVLTFY